MEKNNKHRAIILKDLKSKGFKYKNVDEIFKQSKLEVEEVTTILKWLPKVYMENYGAADILVRSLISAIQPFDPSILIALFDNTDLNFSLKSGIALVLATARTTDISEWIIDQLLNKEYALERVLLTLAVPTKCGFTTNAEIMNFLRLIFDKYHEASVQKFFKKYGKSEDALFLRKKIPLMEKTYQRKFEKIAEAIEAKEK